jgi:hypothetical protein
MFIMRHAGLMVPSPIITEMMSMKGLTWSQLLCYEAN